MSVHTHGERQNAQAKAPEQSPSRPSGTMLWSLLMNNSWSMAGTSSSAYRPFDALSACRAMGWDGSVS